MTPPSDTQLEALLRLAHEAEAIDPPAPRLRLADAAARPAPVFGRALWTALGAAACIGLLAAWAAINRVPAPTPARPSPIAGAITAPGPAAVIVPAVSAVVMSITEGSPGEVRCVRWTTRPEAWGDRKLEDISPEELQSAGLAILCDADARRVLVVGMQGPREKLPADDLSAARLAQCVMATPGCSTHQSAPALVCRPGACLPEQIAVRVESIQLAGR
jgi:hypothetical protein